MKHRANRGGVVLWVFLAIVVVGGWVGFRIGQLYFDHESLKNEMVAIGDRAILDPSYDPKKKILSLFAERDVYLDPEAIKVTFNTKRDRVTIAFPYHRRANLIFFSPDLSFEIYEQREQSKGAGIVQSFRKQVEESNAVPGRRYQKQVQDAFKP